MISISDFIFVGIEPGTNTELEDVMYDFAEICGNYDKRYGTRRWQTLEAAAHILGITIKRMIPWKTQEPHCILGIELSGKKKY